MPTGRSERYATRRFGNLKPGVGIAVPMLIPPLVAAGVGLILAYGDAPAVAYVSGCLGTLIGADLWNLPRATDVGASIISIGGAGTFDAVFLSGILAGLLAAHIAPASPTTASAGSRSSGPGDRDHRAV